MKSVLSHKYRMLGGVWFGLAVVLVLGAILSAPAYAGRGSFGGSRSFSRPSGGSSFGGARRATPPPSSTRSFGGSSSTSMPRASSPSSSTYSRTPGGSTSTSASPAGFGSSSSTRSSFGGSRLSNSTDYTSRYGAPRRTETRAVPSSGGGTTNYVVHSYGGRSDGFMMGYLLGSAPWYYSAPFHPAYYYSRPYTVVNPDGTVSAYPGTFQFGTFLLWLLVIVAIVFVAAKIARRIRGAREGRTEVGAKSSFI